LEKATEGAQAYPGEAHKSNPSAPTAGYKYTKRTPHEAISSPLSKLLVPKLRCGQE
jgi:hypothetical protein